MSNNINITIKFNIMKIIKYKNIALYLLAPFFYVWIKEYGKLAASPFSDFMTIWYLGIVLWIITKIIKKTKKIIKLKKQ
jgi:hypothetical protein|tara:strand:- start:355 stop:591 length:237 start_codon:yes stop_codon:yes gene_type:complete